MPTYTIVENPPPFKSGITTTQTIDADDATILESAVIENRLVDVPVYTIIQVGTGGAVPTPTINNTVIEQTFNIVSTNVEVAALYENISSNANISSRTQLINDGLGSTTYDDNTTPIWNTIVNKIEPTILKEVLDIQLRFKLTTDTLGGTFEIDLDRNGINPIIDTIEEDIRIQDQDYTIRFKIVVDQDMIDNGICIFIKPELGMTLTVLDFSLLITKG